MEQRQVSQLKTNPNNPRGPVEHDVALRELAMSIQSQGVLQPIIITENDYIVAGHRRVAAAKLAGLESVPVIVKKVSQVEQLQMMLVENLQRADLNVLQEGFAYKLLADYGLNISQISKAIGVQGSRVTNCMAIVGLPGEVQRQFAWGVLPVDCARVLSGLPNTEKQIEWADYAVQHKCNGRGLDAAIQGKKRERRSIMTASRVITVAPQTASEPLSPVKERGGPPQLRNMLQRLEEMDEALDGYPDFRVVQSLLRQASSQMIEKLQDRSRAARHHITPAESSAKLRTHLG